MDIEGDNEGRAGDVAREQSHGNEGDAEERRPEEGTHLNGEGNEGVVGQEEEEEEGSEVKYMTRLKEECH